MSAPATAKPFAVTQPEGSPSVVIISHGLLDSAIGYVIAESPFVLKNVPHCSQKKYVAWRALKKYHDHDKGGGSWPWGTGDLYVEKLVT